jgi:ABC-2 type transport system ATP-binding protein
MIEIKGITKRFGDLTAVDRISFSTGEGEIFGLIGPNGAGKSTTIKMIMNILAPDEGEIYFSGRLISEADKEHIGYLPEERGLYKKVKVGDMLRYLADLKGRRPSDSEPRIDAWLERFDLGKWKERKIEELSKGMAQKVQFIAAIAHDPDLLFFDEPFAGLDPVSSDLLLSSIRELGAQGKTILFSTHIMEQAEKICNKILLINKGREVVSGAIADIKRQHGRNSVQIEFDGDISFIEALPFVANITRYPRWIEAELTEADAADRLFQALSGRVSVTRFERVSPSLHQIFVNLVGERGREEE